VARVALPAAVTAAVVVVLWRQLEPGALGALLGSVSPSWLVTGTGCFLALHVVRALRFRALLPGQALSAGELLPLALAVTLLGNTLPARGGEVSFVVLTRAGHGVPAAASTAAIAVARVLDLIAVAAWFVPLALLALPRLPAAAAWPRVVETRGVVALVTAGVLLLAATAAAAAAQGRRAAAAMGRLAERRGWSRRRWVGRVVAFVADTAEALERLRTRRLLGTALGLTGAAWLLTFAWLYAYFRSLGQEAPFGLFVVGVTFAVLSKALPLPSLGGHGPSEAGWALGFTLLGWPPATAIATGLAVSVLNVGTVFLFGLPALAWVGARARRARGA